MQTDKIDIHYAFQACDVKSFQGRPRFCTDDRTLLSKKSLKSFLDSIQYAADKEKNSAHSICIFEDDCSKEYRKFMDLVIKKYQGSQIKIDIKSLNGAGLSVSMEECYKWLKDFGSNLVCQIQDDYMFTESAVYLSIEMFYQIYYKYKTIPIIQPYNDPYFLRNYEGQSVSRIIEQGKHSYWIQIYDTSCSFLTAHPQFVRHWEIFEKFFDLIALKVKNGNKLDLENKSLNYMFTRHGVLGLAPINSLSFHMQTELEKDPYIDWQPIWNSIDIDIQ